VVLESNGHGVVNHDVGGSPSAAVYTVMYLKHGKTSIAVYSRRN
jgi:hypothetical protein